MLEGAGRTTLTASMLARPRDVTETWLLGGALHNREGPEHLQRVDVALEVIRPGRERSHGEVLLDRSGFRSEGSERCSTLLVVHIDVVGAGRARVLVVEVDRERRAGRCDQTGGIERYVLRDDIQHGLLARAVRRTAGTETRNDRRRWVRDEHVLNVPLDSQDQVLIDAVVPGEIDPAVRCRERRMQSAGRRAAQLDGRESIRSGNELETLGLVVPGYVDRAVRPRGDRGA